MTLNWKLDGAANSSSSSPSQEALLAGEGSAPAMSVPAVRGSPYATMEYRGVRPVISARQVGPTCSVLLCFAWAAINNVGVSAGV